MGLPQQVQRTNLAVVETGNIRYWMIPAGPDADTEEAQIALTPAAGALTYGVLVGAAWTVITAQAWDQDAAGAVAIGPAADGLICGVYGAIITAKEDFYTVNIGSGLATAEVSLIRVGFGWVAGTAADAVQSGYIPLPFPVKVLAASRVAGRAARVAGGANAITVSLLVATGVGT